MITTIYEGISPETRKHLTALIALSQFTRKAILAAIGDAPPYASELKKHEVLEWVARYGAPETILMKAYENAGEGD